MTKTLTEQQIRKILENGTEKAAKVCEKKFYGKTKSLTEQWREGTLTGGFYYIQLKDERWPLIDHTDYNLLSHKIEWKDFDWRSVEEVIEEVPSYEEYQQLISKTEQLEKQLAERGKNGK